MDSLEQKVKKYIKEQGLLQSGDKVLVAVSGGADSIALLQSLYSLKDELQIEVCAAHLNHMLRGEESAGDAVFTRSFCDSLQIPCQVESIAVEQEANGENLEDTARKIRYDFLRRAQRLFGAQKIATAHHADDQAETLLLHLVRGAGLEGLAAIAPQEKDLIRPFLCVDREEILAYLARQDLAYRTDSSNFSDRYRRNHMRKYLLPMLRQYNPQVVMALNHTASICREDNTYLEEQATKVYHAMVQKTEDGVQLPWHKLQELPLSLRRRVCKLAFWQAAQEPLWLSYEHLQGFCEMKPGMELALPGHIFAWRKEKNLYIGTIRQPQNIWPEEQYPLSVPGEVFLPYFHKKAYAYIGNAPDKELPTNGMELVLPLRFSRDLYFRTRKAGDTFSPCGMQGRKKLKEYFIDEKIPIKERNQIPLLFAGEELLWIPGKRRSALAQSAQEKVIWVSIR